MQVIFKLLFIVSALFPRAETSDEIESLTETFFANLQANLKGNELNEESRYFVDNQIENYVQLIKNSHDFIESGKRKEKRENRNYLDEIIRENRGTHKLKNIIPLDILDVELAVNIKLFSHEINKTDFWYAAVLRNTIHDNLVILKFNGSFQEILTDTVKNGVDMVAHSIDDKTFLAVLIRTEHGKENVTIYQFDADEKLNKVQDIGEDYISDVAIWDDKEHTFMIILSKKTDSSYETKSNIYKWLGGYFDIIQELETFGAMKATPFQIGKDHFVAVANERKTLDNQEVYSDIYKYDFDEEKYFAYKKLLSRGTIDIQIFSFNTNERSEFFLLVVNAELEKNESTTILYKLVDEEFIPFQSFSLEFIANWLPIRGAKGEFALFATEKYRSKIFQYNGWKFVEVEYSTENLLYNVTRASSYLFMGSPIIVATNENATNMTHIFRVSFQEDNEVQRYQNSMLMWCKRSIQEANNLKHEDIFKTIRSTPNSDNTEIQFSQRMTFDNLTVSDLRTSEFQDERDEEQLALLQTQTDLFKTEVDNIEEALNVLSLQVNVITGDAIAENVIFENDNFFDSIITENINRYDTVELLKNVMNVFSSYNLTKLHLESAVIERDFIPDFVNKKPYENLLFKNEALTLGNFTLIGDAIFNSVIVDDKVNSIKFTRNNVLLDKSEQVFEGDLNINRIDAVNVDTNQLNKLVFSSINDFRDRITQISSINNLDVVDLVVGGFLNHVDIPTLDKYALRKEGDQEISSEYFFDKLITQHLNVTTLNNKTLPKDLIRIDKGKYQVSQDVDLIGDLIVNNLIALKRINEINVNNFKLDVLLHNFTEMQYVTGEKKINNVTSKNPVVLQANIKSKKLIELNNVVGIDQELDISTDCVISGNVTIEEKLDAFDLETENGEYSIQDLLENGLHIRESEIPIHLNFTQQFNVAEIYTDNINGIDPNNWVVNGLNDTQYIKGWKIFEGDLQITGPTNIINANGINLQALESNVLKIEGNQTITGKHHFQKINSESVQAEDIKLGLVPLKNLLINNLEQELNGTVTVQSLKVDSVLADNVDIIETINEHNFKEMLQDTVFKNSSRTVGGNKHFQMLTIESLTSRKSLHMDTIPISIKKGEALFTEDTKFDENVTIANIFFEESLNGISASDFENNWLDSGVIYNDQFLNSVTIFGEASIDTNNINGVNLKELHEETIKIDEPHNFGTVTFENVVALDDIALHGQFEDLDIDNIAAGEGDINILDEINFTEDVIVNTGSITSDGPLNSLNLEALCNFANPKNNEKSKSLTINGNVIFKKGPIINTVNGYDIQELHETVWFANRETTLKGNLYVDELHFKDDVEIQGHVDEIKLEWLKDNYFSKSKNQTITATLDFTEEINCKGNLIAPEAKVVTLNEINLEEFVSTAILENITQVFEETLFSEICKIEDLQGDFLVNNHNLKSDFMRYDVPNAVTGMKTVQSLQVDTLSNTNNFNVQGVDLLSWTQNSVLKSVSSSIESRVNFNNFTEFKNGISLQGLLNQKEFTTKTVMLKSVPQTITGEIVFKSNNPETIKFTEIKLTGQLNNIDLASLIRNQAFKNEDNIFENSVNVNTNLTAYNINFENLYRGVNVSEMIQNLTNYASLNNYYNNYEYLFDISKKVKQSLMVRANYLNYYKAVPMVLNEVEDVFSIKNFYNDANLVALKKYNKSYQMDFYRWDMYQQTFILEAQSPMIELTFVAPLEYSFGSYLYLEQEVPDRSLGHSKFGNIVARNMHAVRHIPNNGTKKVVPFTMPTSNKGCMLMLLHGEHFMLIYCDNTQLVVHQKLDIPNVSTAEILNIDGCLYLVAINEALQYESYVIIWKLDINTELFNEQQIMYDVSPKSISTISYNGNNYIAIASGQLMHTMYPGRITIKRFDRKMYRFVEWQQFFIGAPSHVQFAVLPSNELLLFVLCDNSIQPLVTYKYLGISKFVENSVTSSLMKCQSIQQFTIDQNHFVITKSDDKVQVMRGIFK